jgi:hypothetical protein
VELVLPQDLGHDVVRLRPFEVDDAAVVTVACQDALIQRFTTFPTSTIAPTRPTLGNRNP